LANVRSSPANVQYGRDNQDDGGFGELRLPQLEQCGNGVLSTDCKLWSFSGTSGSSSARAPRVVVIGSSPPTLNFCRDSASYPSDLGRPAIGIGNLSGKIFSLSYLGTKTLPIVTFATHPWTVSITNTFAGTATKASTIGVTPTITDTPGRGYVLFFTWSWPADVLLIPYQINEVQLAASSSPLAIPANSSATLGAFDCIGRPISATSFFGSGFGFSADLTSSTVTSPGPELNVPIFTGAAPSGNAVLWDDRGATAVTPVT
jgi:hypothetical protein